MCVTTVAQYPTQLTSLSLAHTVVTLRICVITRAKDDVGPGGNTSARVQEGHILTSAQAQGFTLEHVFGGTPHWADFKYQY